MWFQKSKRGSPDPVCVYLGINVFESVLETPAYVSAP